MLMEMQQKALQMCTMHADDGMMMDATSCEHVFWVCQQVVVYCLNYSYQWIKKLAWRLKLE